MHDQYYVITCIVTIIDLGKTFQMNIGIFLLCSEAKQERRERKRESKCPDFIERRLALSNEKAIDDRGSFNGFLL